jgi:hypothetical protein
MPLVHNASVTYRVCKKIKVFRVFFRLLVRGVFMSIIVGMAFDRKEFENRLWEKIAGGCSEYYKARLGELLGWPNSTYVGKWDREVERFRQKGWSPKTKKLV